jgi:hypothetical protein
MTPSATIAPVRRIGASPEDTTPRGAGPDFMGSFLGFDAMGPDLMLRDSLIYFQVER